MTYTGVTSDLQGRLLKHVNRVYKGFTYKYNCHYAVYTEEHPTIGDAIKREKQIKKWGKIKKKELIDSVNPDWKFLNDEIFNLQKEAVEMSANNDVISNEVRNLPKWS